MPDQPDEKPVADGGETTLSPDNLLKLAKIERKLASVHVQGTRSAGLAQKPPSRAEGQSRMSPLAHMAR